MLERAPDKRSAAPSAAAAERRRAAARERQRQCRARQRRQCAAYRVEADGDVRNLLIVLEYLADADAADPEKSFGATISRLLEDSARQ